MASPCVLLVDTDDELIGAEAGDLVKAEALRIEAKFSRYRPSVVTRINDAAGGAVEVDSETADLIDYSTVCYRLSESALGATDIAATGWHGNRYWRHRQGVRGRSRTRARRREHGRAHAR